MSNSSKIKYIRIAEMQEYFSLGKSKVYELLEGKHIKSVVIKKRGNSRGVRLIDYQSVVDYFASLEAEQEAQEI